MGLEDESLYVSIDYEDIHVSFPLTQYIKEEHDTQTNQAVGMAVSPAVILGVGIPIGLLLILILFM